MTTLFSTISADRLGVALSRGYTLLCSFRFAHEFILRRTINRPSTAITIVPTRPAQLLETCVHSCPLLLLPGNACCVSDFSPCPKSQQRDSDKHEGHERLGNTLRSVVM